MNSSIAKSINQAITWMVLLIDHLTNQSMICTKGTQMDFSTATSPSPLTALKFPSGLRNWIWDHATLLSTAVNAVILFTWFEFILCTVVEQYHPLPNSQLSRVIILFYVPWIHILCSGWPIISSPSYQLSLAGLTFSLLHKKGGVKSFRKSAKLSSSNILRYLAI